MWAGVAEPPGGPIAPTKLPSRSSRIAGVVDERGRLPPAIAFAAGTGPLAGFQEKSVSWLLRKKPSTMRPDPKYDSIVVVIDTALPRASTMTMWLVPPGSRSEEHTSELQSLMRISYAVFCLKNKTYSILNP